MLNLLDLNTDVFTVIAGFLDTRDYDQLRQTNRNLNKFFSTHSERWMWRYVVSEMEKFKNLNVKIQQLWLHKTHPYTYYLNKNRLRDLHEQYAQWVNILLHAHEVIMAMIRQDFPQTFSAHLVHLTLRADNVQTFSQQDLNRLNLSLQEPAIILLYNQLSVLSQLNDIFASIQKSQSLTLREYALRRSAEIIFMLLGYSLLFSALLAIFTLTPLGIFMTAAFGVKLFVSLSPLLAGVFGYGLTVLSERICDPYYAGRGPYPGEELGERYYKDLAGNEFNDPHDKMIDIRIPVKKTTQLLARSTPSQFFYHKSLQLDDQKVEQNFFASVR